MNFDFSDDQKLLKEQGDKIEIAAHTAWLVVVSAVLFYVPVRALRSRLVS